MSESPQEQSSTPWDYIGHKEYWDMVGFMSESGNIGQAATVVGEALHRILVTDTICNALQSSVHMEEDQQSSAEDYKAHLLPEEERAELELLIAEKSKSFQFSSYLIRLHPDSEKEVMIKTGTELIANHIAKTLHARMNALQLETQYERYKHWLKSKTE